LAKVKEKAGISVSTFDTKVSNLISDWVAVIEYALDPAFLGDTGNTGLQATLNLGATELVAGEFLAQLAREPGGSESLVFGWVEVHPSFRDLTDPFGLKNQGALRLGPFLKDKDSLIGALGVLAGGDRGALP
jgi:hypothetical protein